MCSTCGQRAAKLRKPGGSPRNPILFGARTKEPARPATFLEPHGGKKVGEYGYVAGDGVDAAVEAGTIELGVAPVPRLVPKAKAAPADEAGTFYVSIGVNKWKAFRNRSSAVRFASIRGVPVLTQDEAIAQNLRTKD